MLNSPKKIQRNGVSIHCFHQLTRATFLVIFYAGVLLSSAYAEAPDVKDDGDICWDGQADDSGKSTAGKPINLYNGSESLYRTDLSIGKFYPIVVERRYNSSSVYDSQLGYGWALNFNKRLYTYPDGSITVRKGCGEKHRFLQSSGGFAAASGDSGTLVLNADGSYVYTDKYGSKEIYDSFGRLSSLIDTKGSSLVLTYEAELKFGLTGVSLFSVNPLSSFIISYDYRLIKIEEKDPSGILTGTWVTFAYDTATGRLNGIWDSTGRAVTYRHDDNFGNLTGVVSLSGNASYAYNDPKNSHLLTDIDEGKGLYKNTYDAEGRVARQEHNNGTLDIEYIVPGQKTRLTTIIKSSDTTILNTQIRIVEFDGSGTVIKNTDTFGHVTNYIRDLRSSKILREEYWENTGTNESPDLALKSATEFSYDNQGNMLTRIEAQGTPIEKITTYTYDPTNSLVTTETVSSVVNLSGQRVITNTYYPNGSLRFMTETGFLGDGSPYTFTTAYDYHPNGKLKTIDGPRTDVQDVTTLDYTSEGYLWKTTQPLVGTTSYSNFDPLGNPQTVTDPNGNSTTYTYDSAGRVTSVKAPGDANATQYFYISGGSCGSSCSGANKIDHITLPEGNTISYGYDSLGNLAAITDSLGNSINYSYDSEGSKLTEQIKDASNTLQKSLSYTYDALKRLAKLVNPDSTFTQYEYDSRGNRISVKDPKGNATTYNYDALNRLTSTVQPGAITTSYGYIANGKLTTVTDANMNATVYKYSDHGDVYQVISPDTGATTYSYDPAGNMISKTDAKGITVSYTYDATNRLTRMHFPSDTDIVYSYDSCVNGKGRLCSMTDQSGITVYEYAPKGQVRKETRTIDGIWYVTQYKYDQNGNLKTLTYPSGRVITYNYSNDRAVSVLNNAANLATNIQYKPFGGVSSLTYGNGLPGSISYDNQYRITGITAGSVMNLSYPTYDANGNIMAINNVLDPTKNKTLGYDALDRLTSGTGSWGSLTWTYDGVGNRLTEGVTSYTYQPNMNKLNNVGGVSYGFDNNGNTTTEGARQFIYNQNQRLIRVVVAGVTKSEFTYNGNGQRVKKVVSGTAMIFHYDRNGLLIAESDAAGNIIAEYVYLNGNPLTKIEGSNVYFYHDDNLGTPQKMTDSAGALIWSADYKPFGEATIDASSTIMSNLRFPGQYYDAETGLYQNWNRDYNSDIGSYIEADPMGILEGTNHIYVYARNNALRFKDPQGLDTAGCDGVPDWLETPCRLECCAQHDECFKKNNCTSKSWYSKCSKDCDSCNTGVKNCFMTCKFTDKDDPDKQNYYCAKLDKYISLKDHDYNLMKKFCESK